MLANLLPVPTDDNSWSSFSFNLRDEIDKINAAILAQNNVSLNSYQIDPIPWDNLYTWLVGVSQAMSQITSVLGLQAQDVLAVDLRDIRQRAAWVNIVYSELYDAEATLGI